MEWGEGAEERLKKLLDEADCVCQLCVGHTLSLAWGLAVTSEPFVTASIARDPRTHLSWIWGLHMASLGSAEHLAVFTWKKLNPVLK